MVELNYCDKHWVIECCVLTEQTICNPLRNHSATWPKHSYDVFKSFDCLIKGKSMTLRSIFL